MQVYKSQLQDVTAFKKAVEKHIADLTAHTKTKGVPAPQTHALVEHSVKRVAVKGRPDSFVPDYEIIDDSPPETKLSLDDRKTLLVGKLRNAELDAVNALIPERKRRLFSLQVREIQLKPEDQRTEDDKALLAKHDEIDAKYKQFQYKSAEAEAAIEDLTEATIDKWQLPQLE